ncbi:hypothetical protein BJ170DRAFT_403633 [Xylariales sp. AK1849]|nr:hypothetical protein BJ170DRAFT_403633 [Xylariales sp. AK1849]
MRVQPLVILAVWLFSGHWADAAANDGDAIYKQLPKCAKNCHKLAARSVGCGIKDLECLCEKQDAYTRWGKDCIKGACGAIDALRARSIAEGACERVHEEL